MIKKVISVILTVCIFTGIFSVCSYAYNVDDISAQCAVVMVAGTGEVVYSRNMNERHSMASTTKIMTSLIAVEQGTPQKKIVVTADQLNVEGTSMGLQAGDTVYFETLIHGMLLQSGNDAANVTAITIAGNVQKFAKLMNERASKIGMKNTHFVTPSGLDNEEHYSTAYDMALLACQAVKNPEFLSICSKKTAALYYGNPPYRRILTNHNRLLWSYDGCLGVKTGYTKKSGRCLVSYAERDNVGLVVVTLNAPDDWNDHRELFNYGFSKVKSGYEQEDVSKILIPVVGSSKANVSVASEKVAINRADNSTLKITKKVFVEPFLYAPVSKGDVVGKVCYYSGKKLLAQGSIVAAQSIKSNYTKTAKKTIIKENAFKRFFKKLKRIFS